MIENHADGEYIIFLVGNKVDQLESDEFDLHEEVQWIID